jgi:DNA polymerase epsilon subunit 1
MSGYESRKRDRRDSWSSKKQQKLMRSAEEDLESKLGVDLFSEGEKRLGWLLTFAPVS